MAETHPELARPWHPTRNGEGGLKTSLLDLRSELRGCAQRPAHHVAVHEWEARIFTRTKAGNPSGDPFCSGHRICKCSSLAAKRPDLIAQWDCVGDSGLNPEHISLSSGRKVSWYCNQHGSWTATINHRSCGSGCPKSGKLIKVKDEHPELIAQLPPTKNEHINLDKVTRGSKSRRFGCATTARVRLLDASMPINGLSE